MPDTLVLVDNRGIAPDLQIANYEISFCNYSNYLRLPSVYFIIDLELLIVENPYALPATAVGCVVKTATAPLDASITS